jgi:UDP-N-acetyl-D-mannosaminuronic acid dehydrogenase
MVLERDALEGPVVDRLSVIGLGYIGLPTAAMFASEGVEVVGVDISQHVVDAVNSGKAHIEEGNLDELVERCVRAGKLRATLKPEPADAFIIAVPTPVGHDDTHSPDLSYVRAAGRAIAPLLRPGNVVILESTSPVGTTAMLARLFAEMRPDLRFPQDAAAQSDICLAYCPERIIPGRMLEELVDNDRIIGGMTPRCAERAARLYKVFVRGACHLSDDRVAEMVKLAENAFRDVNIAFANEMSMVCNDIGVDVWKVIEFANRHPRVSILTPGAGVGGHCIAVDPWFVVASAPERARLMRTAREVNDAKPHFVVAQVEQAVASKPGAKIVCLGLTYKPDVDDFRESPSLRIASVLSGKYPEQVVCVDPFSGALPERDRNRLGLQFADVDEALSEADIVVVLVAHTAFRGVPRPEGAVLIDPVGFWR